MNDFITSKKESKKCISNLKTFGAIYKNKGWYHNSRYLGPNAVIAYEEFTKYVDQEIDKIIYTHKK